MIAARALLATLFLTTVFVYSLSPNARGDSPPTMDVLVVAGQSNALGYDSYVIDPKTHRDIFTDASRSPADRKVLLTWDESQVLAASSGAVALDTPQIRAGARSPIFGPELGLARALYAAGRRHLLVVKVATDGSSLAQDWLPGDDDFKLLLAKANGALKWATAHGFVPKLAGVYFFQGETDALNASWAAEYGTNLRAFLSGLRHMLPLASRIPIDLAQIDLTDFLRIEQATKVCQPAICAAEWKGNAEVMAAQASVASKYTFVTPTSRMARFENFIHLSNVGELALGRAFAKQTASLIH
jgi:hypothetical protein